MKVVLIGYMGSGKSLVGSRLSEVTSKPFIDLDTEIENETGFSIPELFKVKGEIFFRKKEQEVLRNLLKKETSFVLATGGGTPCYGSIMQEINETENVHSFFLNTSINVLTERLFEERKQRPLIAHIQTKELLQDFIRKHIFERNFYYLQAQTKIDADRTVEEIVSKILLTLF